MTYKSCILLRLGFVLDVLTVENLTVTIAVCIKHRPIEFGHWSVQFYATTTLLLCCR